MATKTKKTEAKAEAEVAVEAAVVPASRPGDVIEFLRTNAESAVATLEAEINRAANYTVRQDAPEVLLYLKVETHDDGTQTSSWAWSYTSSVAGETSGSGEGYLTRTDARNAAKAWVDANLDRHPQFRAVS